MRRYIMYLKYIIRHKWFVFIECIKCGLIWRGIKHDWAKFLPSELIPYARFFYEPDGTKRQIRDKTGYYKPDDTGDSNFDFAWLLHQKRSDHHWQWWILPKDDGTVKVFPMSLKARKEMICDWRGAGRAQGTPDTMAWYEKNKGKMTFHEDTRKWIESILYCENGKC